eukprot:gnl/MRDRNA2_/MRDRNA2_101647_c0_seq1.p1 gnl/MRDRNA2_/MRDRNA2_101647_c0~~gnl/MRDRNA2_/MRDRNA2_101647_c0_seq1.p1  ORF type:complete len:551 (-),score=139.69 gnl/MRDRNA2_/MRDRNA2_101647_c0_seq1:45-1658(-)
MDFVKNLPKPQGVKPLYEVGDSTLGSFKAATPAGEEPKVAVAGAPPYGKRKGWTPRVAEDYGDGGAYPEIHCAQYPLEMGRQIQQVSRTVALQMDADGRMAWDAVLRQGKAKEKWAMHTRPEDLKEKWSSVEDLERPTDELDQINTERTQKALEELLNKKIQAAAPQRHEVAAPEFVRYTPNKTTPGYTENCEQRIIRITERPRDPFDPPRFKHKKVPRGPPSPPPPIHHSPARKLTQKDQREWRIPPCVSNWKNVKGYTIPLDKRLAADGRSLQDVSVNDKFAALSEDLYLAERKAREEIKIRNDMVRQKKIREEEVREQQLRKLAADARAQRQELSGKGPSVGEDDADAKARAARMEVMNDRKREIERDQRLELAGKKAKRIGREADRDLSERIALGQVAQPTSQETQYDSRLFNQSAGMDSGFHGGDDEKVTVYEKPLFADRSDVTIYKHDRERLEQNTGRLAHIGNETAGEAPKSKNLGKSKFAGTEEGGEYQGGRSAPVEFEREQKEDPFGLGQLMEDAGKTRDPKEKKRKR